MRSSRLIRSLALVFAVGAGLAVRVRLGAQSDAVGIKGVVKDSSGSPVAGASVVLRNETAPTSASAVTGADGSYEFATLSRGLYTVEAEGKGFEKVSRLHIKLDVRPEVVDLVLRRSATASKPGDLSQTLGGIDYYDKPEFRAGPVADPTAAGGYSDSVAATRGQIVKDYLAQSDVTTAGHTIQVKRDQGEEAIYRSGSQLLARQAFAPAIDVFSHGVERYPRSARLEMGLGTALYAHGQYDGAVRALLAATDLAPADFRPYLFLAKAFNAASAQSRRETPEVVKRLARFTAIEPASAQAHYYYALALWKAGRGNGPKLALVEAELRRAAALGPRLPDAHLELGTLLAGQQRYADAIREYQEAIRLKPDLAAAHYRLGQLLARTGAKTRAQEELDTYERLRKLSDGGVENPR